MSSARSASFASALSQGASFAFDDLDVAMDSPIARYPPGGKRAVTIMSPNAERERMAEQENLGSMTPAAKRSAAPTPQSILKSTPARSTARSVAPGAAVQPPPSASKFRVTNTTSAAPAPSAPAAMKPSRTAPNTPRRSRSRAMSELSEMGVTPYVDRYVAELKSKQDEREEKEAQEAAAKRAAAREAKKQAAATAAAASQQEERKAHHRKRHQAAARDESDEASSSDEDAASPKGRQTNPAVRALRNAMNMDVATPAAWKGRGADPTVDGTARNTIEMEADELMRQPDLLSAPAAPVAKKGAKASKIQAKPAPKKVAPKKAASRRQRSPSYDDNDFGDDGNYDDYDDGASDASYDIAPPAKAHRGQKQQQPAATTRPRRRLTAQAEDVESALLSAAPAPAAARGGASRGRSKVTSAAAAPATRAVSSKRGMSKSMEPLIIRRRSGGPAAAQAMFAGAQDDDSPYSNDASPNDVDIDSSDDDAASPLAKQRAARGRGPAAAATRAPKPVQPAVSARAATRGAGGAGAKKKAVKAAVRQAEPIAAPQRGNRRGGRHAPSVTFAQHHPVPDDSDEFTDDFGDDGEADTAPRIDPYAGYDDVIDSISTGRQPAGNAHHRQPQDRYERLAHGAANAATNAFSFGAGQATFRPKLDRAPSMRQPSNRRPAATATSLAPPAARSRPQSMSMAPPPAAANDPLRAFMQAAFPDQVNMPPNLSALQASNKGIRLPLTISKKKRAI